MQVHSKKGSALAGAGEAKHFEIVLNFCRTVVRSDEIHLQYAMWQYQQSLLSQQRG